MPGQRRRFFQFRLLTVFVAVALLGLFIVLNTRPSELRLLGHVSSREPPIFPGLWITGYDYGWPWPYRTESFKTEAIKVEVFDHFEWKLFVADVAVGLAISAMVIVLLEGALAWVVRRKSQ